VVFRSIHNAGTKGARPGAGSGIHSKNDAGGVGKVWKDKRGSKPVDGWDSVYAEKHKTEVEDERFG
jgi:hypothetical protein